jgi:transposase
VKIMPHRRLRYIGLDVHRATIAVAIAEEEGPPSSYGTIANEPATVRKLMRQLGGKDVELAGVIFHKSLK